MHNLWFHECHPRKTSYSHLLALDQTTKITQSVWFWTCCYLPHSMVLILWDQDHCLFYHIIVHKTINEILKKMEQILFMRRKMKMGMTFRRMAPNLVPPAHLNGIWTFSEILWIVPLHISYLKISCILSLCAFPSNSPLFSTGSYHFRFLVSISGSRPSKIGRVTE